jgi:methionyl aminopeptidase
MAKITLRSKREIEFLREAGRIVYRVHETLHGMIRPGVNTSELEEAARKIIEDAKAEPLFLGVPNPESRGGPFPACTCISINEEVVHGIPGERELRDGDIVSIDVGVRLNGYCGDAATTVGVNDVGPDGEQLIRVTRDCLSIAIREARPGRKWSEVAAQMEKRAVDAGFSVVKKYAGHGIGTSMWEEPKVPNYVSSDLKRNDFELKTGMVLAVEPMVNVGRSAVETAADGWTVVTKDRKPSAHVEHMFAMTADGADVLTDGR